MRRVLLACAAMLALSGCVSLIDSAYDDQARSECDQQSAARRGACYDRVDQHRRDRERARND